MPRNDFRLVPRRKLRDDVQEQLLAAIDRGTSGAGAELPSERELMTQMGVGRPAVREALLTLEERGLITVAHGRRARVCAAAPLGALELARRITLAAAQGLDRDNASVLHLNDARLQFEAAMVRLAAERATSTGILMLKRALAANRRAISDAERYLATDMALHRTIAVLSGNPLLAAVGDALYSWLPRFRIRMVHVEGANLLSYDEHAHIVDRIAAHDPEGAMKASEKHLARSHSLYHRLGANAEPGEGAATRAVRSREQQRGA